jgi:hypothetical protein
MGKRDRDDVVVEDNDRVIYNGIHMEAFIPDEYFKNALAEEVEAGYNIFGNFITYHHASEGAKREDAQIASFELPFMFVTIPDNVTTETVDIGYGLRRYIVLHYYKGGVLITRREMIQKVSNVEKMTTLLFEGKMDNVDYDRMPTLYNSCKKYNGAHLRVPAMYEEVVIAQTYRNPKNITESARFKATGSHDRTIGMTLREKSAFNTFSGATGEDKISMLTVADNAKRENRKEVISDIEKVSFGDNLNI